METKRIILLMVILIMTLSLVACTGTETFTEDSPESQESCDANDAEEAYTYTYEGDFYLETYYNDLFGYSISYPNIFEAMFESDNGDGIVWETPDDFCTADGSLGGRIVRYDGEVDDTLLIYSDGEIIAKLPLYDMGETQLINAEWLKAGLGLTFHINPSLDQYIFVDFLSNYEMSSYYGYGFTWAPNWNNLYYISPPPHGSDDTDDSLTDMFGTIYYVSEGGIRLNGAIAATPDGRYIACDLLNPDQRIDLLILDTDDVTSAIPVGVINGFAGVASFSDNETLTISTVESDESYLISDIID